MTFIHTSQEFESDLESCSCPKQKSIPFLDTPCSAKNNRIDIDLCRKNTDRNKYLLPNSCHPRQTCRSIPYWLARLDPLLAGHAIVRICTDPNNIDKRLEELNRMILDRN